MLRCHDRLSGERPVLEWSSSVVASESFRACSICLLIGLFMARRYLTWYSLVCSSEFPMVLESLSDKSQLSLYLHGL